MKGSYIGDVPQAEAERQDIEIRSRIARAQRLAEMAEHEGWADLTRLLHHRLKRIEEALLAGSIDPSEFKSYTGERRGILLALEMPSREAEFLTKG